MSVPSTTFPSWLTEWMDAQKIVLWGVADLRDFPTPQDETGHGFLFALSWAIPMNPQIMVSIQNGPNHRYADEYARVNNRINEI
ncbi:MAG: epoxyqueuosine reductase, partial [Syntrophales bacterium]